MPRRWRDRLVLNLPPEGELTQQALKKAFMMCSLYLHPDKNTDPDATAAYQRVTEAYSVLQG